MANEGEVLRQIDEALQGSKEQLKELREAVERAERMGAAQVSLQVARGARELALIKLGEAVFKLIQLGEMEIPPALKRAVADVQARESEVKQEQSDISALLQEAEAAVGKPEKAPPKKAKKK